MAIFILTAEMYTRESVINFFTHIVDNIREERKMFEKVNKRLRHKIVIPK